MGHVYREKSIQLASIDWMTREWGYQELAADVEATGDRMDSVGILDGSVIAIEVKPAVHAGIVRFQPNRSGSLESKIAATLGGLYHGAISRQHTLLTEHWQRSRPPEIAVLAGEYTGAGLSALQDLLADRGASWRFNSRIWQWKDNRIQTLFRFDEATAAETWADVQVPILVGNQPRTAALAVDALLELARNAGHEETLSAFVAEAKSGGYRVKFRPTGLTIISHSGRGAFISLFLTDVDPIRGINVGLDVNRFDIGRDQLPGTAAPRAGFMNTNRYIGSAEAASKLFSMIAI